MRLRFDRLEVPGDVVPWDRVDMMNLIGYREGIEAMFRDVEKPMNVDRIISPVDTAADVLVALASVL